MEKREKFNSIGECPKCGKPAFILSNGNYGWYTKYIYKCLLHFGELYEKEYLERKCDCDFTWKEEVKS